MKIQSVLLFLFIFSLILPAMGQQTSGRSVRTGTDAQSILRYCESLAGTMNQNLRNVQDENARLEAKLTVLEQKVKEISEVNKALENEVASLKRQIAADSAARESQLKKVGDQLDKLAKMPVPAPVPVTTPSESKNKKKSSTAEKTETVDSGSLMEYEVQPGATLSAIAKASGCTVAEIKKINNLKNNNLRVGQKLKVPVKQ